VLAYVCYCNSNIDDKQIEWIKCHIICKLACICMCIVFTSVIWVSCKNSLVEPLGLHSVCQL